MKRTTSLFLALSLAINFLIGGFLIYQYAGLPSAAAIIKDPGTYGPPAMEIIDGATTISTSDVTLQNTLVTGNLYLTQEIDHDVVTLNQVEVQGDMVISGGGDYKLLLKDCKVGNIIIENNDGALTIIAQGQTTADLVDINGEVTLQEDDLAHLALGFKNIRVNTTKRVLLLGDFNSIDATAKADIMVARGSIEAVNILSAGAVVDLATDVTVNTAVVDAIFYLTGNGRVDVVDLNVPGLILLQGQLGQVTCRTHGIFLEFHAGSMEKLLVPPMETAVSIMLAEDTLVEYVELNARAGFTGRGQVEKAVINHDGVTMDRPPATIEIEEGLMAMIAGEEYIREPEPEPEPQPEPEPTLPTVGLNNLSAISLLVGDSGTKNLRPDPTDAKLSVSSNDTSVATVSLLDSTLKVEGKKSGTATITVKAIKNGYQTRTRTFKVAVNALSDVKEFRVIGDAPGLPGYKVVLVTLHDPDQSKYTVKIGDVELRYRPENKNFQGVVLENQAKESNVRVR